MTSDSLIDTMAGNYRLVARLGAGGMGEVYKGVHTTIGSKVAIKLLHAMAARDRAMQERFLLEAQAVNRIDHPGVVKVIDAGRTERGRPFLVMELLEGQSLHDLRKAGQLTIEEACRAMVDVLDALAAAHAAGVVHRDLKPANLFRTKDGRTVVLDFGVAKLMASDAPVRLTMTGSAVGTPHYMAPEQIRGQPVTPLVDVYAAGVVLFELLCNRRPFDNADDESVLAGHLERRPPPPRALEPAIPTRVSDLILAALQKDPAKRPPSAAAMRDALKKAIGDSTPQRTRSVPPPPEESASLPTAAESPHARDAARPARWRTLAVAGVAVFALVGLVLVIYAAKRSKAEHAASATPIVAPATEPTPPVDALVATCEQLVTVDPVGVPDAEQVAVKATFYQRCAEDHWDVEVVQCFISVTTAFDLTRCVTALTGEQRRQLESALAGPWSPLAGPEPVGPEAFVSITSVPSRATLTVDGVELGETPWAGRLPVKSITVDVVKENYVPHRSTFDVRGDGENVIKIRLKKPKDPY